MADELLRIENVTKKYGKTVANSDISFSVNAGETAVLLGPNGAGKSTIIKCIAGLLRFSGDIYICGEKNKSLPAKRELGLHTGASRGLRTADRRGAFGVYPESLPRRGRRLRR